jgi:uncharacterized protein (DUF4415 family)
MKKTNKSSKGGLARADQVVIDVTKDDYRREIRSGVSDEHALQPGRHVFRRGGFKARHPDVDLEKTPVKVRVNIYLDRDIVDHFKDRARSPDAAKYQTQINNALRLLVDNKTTGQFEFAPLIESDEFIEAVAERVAQKGARRGTPKKGRHTGKTMPTSGIHTRKLA